VRDRTPDSATTGGLGRILDKLERRVRELETPTGTSVRSLIQQVKTALANITTTVQTAIAAQSYTKAQIDARITSTPGAVTVNGDQQVTGTQAVNGGGSYGGPLTAGGVANFPAGIRSSDVRLRVLSSNYAVTYTGVSNDGGPDRLGISPSSRRFKKDIETWTPNMQRLMQLRPVLFRFNWETTADDRQVGFIAEELEALGSWTRQFLYYELDENGIERVLGINYDRLTPIIIAFTQNQETRLVQAVSDIATLNTQVAGLLKPPVLP